MDELVVVKKRGRPAKAGSAAAAVAAPAAGSASEIPKKRGRPPKAGKGRGRPKAAAVEASDNEDDEEENGEQEQLIVSKGRGRPRKVQPQAPESNSGNDDDDADSSAEEKVVKQQKTPQSAKRRKLGRPRKHQPSDDDGKFYKIKKLFKKVLRCWLPKFQSLRFTICLIFLQIRIYTSRFYINIVCHFTGEAFIKLPILYAYNYNT